MLGVYLYDIASRYYFFLLYPSPILVNYYLSMLPIDVSAFVFDAIIIYFLFSARRIILDRVLGGAGNLSAVVLTAYVFYLLKFIFLNIFVFLSLVPFENQMHFFLLYQAFIFRLMVFFFAYLAFALSLEYSKSVKWYFGQNYKGIFSIKRTLYYPINKYLLLIAKVFLAVIALNVALFFPIEIYAKVMISLLFVAGTVFLLFFKKKK